MAIDLTTIQNYLVSQNFVWSYIGFIVLYFVAWSLALFWRRTTLGNAIRQGMRAVGKEDTRGKFANGFARIDGEIAKNRALGDAWSEFTECLILPTDASPTKEVQNTRDPSSYFSAASIIDPKLNVRFYSSIPGHLTGLGILGTFLGLAAGIGLAQSGLSTPDATRIQESLQLLLQGASLAFLTSIAGLVTSIAFLVFERWQLASLDRQLSGWVRLLDERLLRVTQEKIASDQLHELREQTAALKSFNTELAVSIAEALDEKVAQRLSPQIAELKEALQGMRSDQGEVSDRLINSVVAKFEQTMTGAAGREMDALGETLQKLNSAVTASSEGMERQQERMSASLAEMAALIQGSLGESSSQLQQELGTAIARLTRASERSAEAMREASEAAGASTRSAMQGAADMMGATLTAAVEALSNRLEESSGRVSQSLSSAGESAARRLDATAEEVVVRLASLNEGFDRSAAIAGRLDDVVLQVTGAAEALGDAGTQLREVMPSLRETSSGIRMASLEIRGAAETVAELTESIADSSQQLRAAQDRVAQSWQEYSQKFDRTDEQLAGIFRQIEEGLDRYTTRIRTFTVEVDQSLAKAVGTLTAVVDDLGQVLEDMGDRQN